jgi:hypothetical protein
MAKNSKASKSNKKKYTLKEVYKSLLVEAIITPAEFLERIVNIVEKKPKISGKYGPIIKKLLEKTKETKLLAFKSKENKRDRKLAEFEIIKSLQAIKGIDGNPINLKRMRPLYDSLAKYLETSVDANIDDCLKSADYYMKEFYVSADKEDVDLITKGKFNFATVFKRTNFYQSVDEYKSQLSGMDTSGAEYFDVYESPDKKIKIVYPLSSYAFNLYIKNNNSGQTLTWCTQSESTWFSYNKKQYVMIMTVDSDNKEERLISLKVSKEGTIDKYETCDADNQHMNDRLDSLLSLNLVNSVKSATQSLNEKIKTSEITLVDKRDESKEVIKGLVELNRYSDIIDILNYSIVDYAEGIEGLEGEHNFEIVINTLNSEARANTQKKESILNAYTDFLTSSYIDNNIDLRLDSYLQFFETKSAMDLFYKRLIEKSLNHRSHEKYFITLIDDISSENQYIKTVNIEDHAAFFGDPKEVLENCLLNSLNTNNILFFKRIIKSSLEIEYIKKNILTENFNGILKTKGFSRLVDARKENIINTENEEDKSELYLQETIFQEQNKEIVSQILQEKQIDIKNTDMRNFICLIERFNKTRDEKHLTKENIDRHLISQNREDYNNAIEKITSDLSFFNNMFSLSKQDDFDIEIFKLFINAKDSQNLINYNERSYIIFDHIINQRSENELYRAISSSNPDRILDLIEIVMQNFKKSKEEVSIKLANTMLKGLKILIPVILRNQKVSERYTSNEENFKQIINIADANNDYFDLFLHVIDFLPIDKYPSDYAQSLAKDLFDQKMFKASIKFLKSNDVDYLLTKESILRLGYHLLKNNKIADTTIIDKLFKVYFKTLSSYERIDVSFCFDFLDIIMLYFKDKQTLSTFIKDNFEITVYNKELFFKIIEEFNKLKIAFNKEKLGKFMSDDNFKSLDKNTRLSFYENLITISSDGHANHLDLIDDIDKVKSILAYNLKDISKSSGGLKRETTNFVDDLEDIINFISRLRSASRKKLSQAIPQAKTIKRLWQQQPHDHDDYFESLLRQYLKLMID